jgi:hypothetical protein
MPSKKRQRCPLFPESECPQGKKASNACRVRINGDFDPVAYFKDLLVMHCALYAARQQKEIKSRVQ